MPTLAECLVRRLHHRGWTFALAESCTGGGIGAAVTAVPGASDVFLGGVICYSNESKIRDLGVPARLLKAHGAVSEPIAVRMAEGIRRRFGSDCALAVTGIAGPGGGSREKPVGLVYIAVIGAGGAAVVRRFRFRGGRAAVRAAAVHAALRQLAARCPAPLAVRRVTADLRAASQPSHA